MKIHGQPERKGEHRETVSEAARDLRDSYKKTGSYSAQKMQLVFGDPRRGVAGKAFDQRCAASLRTK